jgi:hypothetical protein
MITSARMSCGSQGKDAVASGYSGVVCEFLFFLPNERMPKGGVKGGVNRKEGPEHCHSPECSSITCSRASVNETQTGFNNRHISNFVGQYSGIDFLRYFGY